MLTIILIVIFLLSLLLLYWFPVRHWLNHWGKTANEVTSIMPGDKVIANPTNSAMHSRYFRRLMLPLLFGETLFSIEGSNSF